MGLVQGGLHAVLPTAVLLSVGLAGWDVPASSSAPERPPPTVTAGQARRTVVAAWILAFFLCA